MTLSVIIVSYNVKAYLEQCLHSVWAATPDIETEVFVVDNNSTDGSVEYLARRFPAARFPDLHVLANPHNVGFGRANNQATRLATGRYVLYLNPDTVLTKDTLKDCIDFADRHPDLGALGVKMLKSDGSFAYESRRGLPTPWTAFCKMCGLNHLFPYSRRFGHYYMRYLDEHQPNAIEVVSGAFMLIPHKALAENGAFDEDFFMYGEDIDLSYRLTKAGHTNYYLPTPILHYKGESTQKSSFRYVHVFYQAMLIFFNKHYKHYRLWVAAPIQAAIYARALLAMFQQLTDNFRSLLTIGQKEPETRMLFLGKPQNIAAMKELNRKWMTTIDYEVADRNSHPDGHHSLQRDLSKYQYIVYDIAAYDYKDIFRIFSQSPTPSLQMGFYSRDNNVLITNSFVLQ